MANQKKHSRKEIFTAYAWLITNCKYTSRTIEIFPPYQGVPKYIVDTIKNNSRIYEGGDRRTFINPISAVIFLHTKKCGDLEGDRFFAMHVEDLMGMVLKEDIPRLHTRDGQEIVTKRDRKRLEDEVALDRFGFLSPNYKSSVSKYLSTEIDDILKKLSQKTKKRKHRIPDKKFIQAIKETEKQCPKASYGKKVFFKELSKLSKLPKYDKTGRGYTPRYAKKRYYEVYHLQKSK